MPCGKLEERFIRKDGLRIFMSNSNAKVQRLFLIAIFFACIPLWSCDRRQTKNVQLVETGANRAADTYPFSMLCSPLLFSKDQSINITLPMPHGKAMVINTPNQGSFYISADGDEPAEGDSPPIKGSSFVTMKQISLDAQTKALNAFTGKTDRIFVKPGDYEIIVGEWLDGDEAPWQGYCRVHYSG